MLLCVANFVFDSSTQLRDDAVLARSEVPPNQVSSSGVGNL
jgi:hypothetical protein